MVYPGGCSREAYREATLPTMVGGGGIYTTLVYPGIHHPMYTSLLVYPGIHHPMYTSLLVYPGIHHPVYTPPGIPG